MSEGQYFGKEERKHLLARSPEFSLQPKSGSVIEGVEEPIMISNIYEQDYWIKEGNQYILKGVSIAIVIDPTDKNDKPLISVSTHIDDNYVMDNELKIFIHKIINQNIRRSVVKSKCFTFLRNNGDICNSA